MNAKKSLILILLIIASVAILYFFVLPSWDKLSNKKDRLTQVTQEREDSKKAKEDLEKFLEEFASLDEESKTLDKALPLSEPFVAQVLDGLDELAKSSGLLLSNLSFVPDKDEKIAGESNTVGALEVTFSASGSYASFKNFLLRLENSLRIIDILDLSLIVDEDTKDLQILAQFKTYYQN